MATTDWQLLTPTNIQVRRAWGWGHSIQKILAATRCSSFEANNLTIASDFGGEHRQATHHIYGFLIVAGGGQLWRQRMRATRTALLGDKRRMSYKRLNDALRRNALVEYLKAAASLNGGLVIVAIDKQKRWLTTNPGADEPLREAFGIKQRWSDVGLERMMRKIHLVSLILSVWARRHCNITWITDEDEFVANDARHDDALNAAGRMANLYTPMRSGVFRLNRTSQDPTTTEFEDWCSIPDLACGMISETMSALTSEGPWPLDVRRQLPVDLSWKADVIGDWFWDDTMPLRKVLISIDMLDDQFTVRRLNLLMP
ncbi:MAG: hypothetical protein QM759_08600 [Terricaulis sp.]